MRDQGLRIIFVCGGGYVYGKELLSLTLMKEVQARGHMIHCLYSSWNNGDFPRKLKENALPATAIPIGFISKTLNWSNLVMTLDQIRNLPSLWFGYRRLIRSLKPDVVIHSNFHHVLLLWPLLRKTKNVFHVHDCFAPSTFYRALFRLLNRRVHLFVGVSRFVAETLPALGIPKEKISYVLNGVPGFETNGRTIGSLSSKSNDQSVSIGIVGQVGRWKGHDDLIEALKLTRKGGSEFVCRIFGSGDPDYTEDLKHKIKTLGLGPVVEWQGFVHDRELIYSKIDFCVVPSRVSETFGMSAAEASLYGKPVIASKQGALPEIVVDQQTGYLIDSASPHKLAEKIGLLLHSKQLRERMGDAARQHALQNLTSSRMADEFEAALFSVLIQGPH